MNIFEQATRMQLRFETQRAMLSVEDLWKLPLSGNNDFNLDYIAIGINKKIKEKQTESFVTENKNDSMVKELELKLDILKHIIAVKLNEKKNAENKLILQQKREKLLRIKESKEDEALKEMTLEDIEKELAELK